MTKNELRDKRADLENLIAIQKNSLESGYMHGMLNGLICAHSVLTGTVPDFVSMSKKSKSKIRHKSRR